ncbi:aminotransferase class V-fold PLP-dependent enzyme [Roseovarius sp.]|uniref:aminotransferase class V-fold PLP-dependent enzyme n=1 Tax=Roseovarius sp. TaxID=1486281 RepID=UPI003B5992F6
MPELPRGSAWTAAEIARARAETAVLADRTHLNSCGTGAMPGVVVDTVIDHLRLEARLGGYEAAALRSDEIGQVYLDLARLVGGAEEDIAIFDSATSAWQSLVLSVPFRPGDRVLVTQSEYASNVMTLLRLGERYDLHIDVLPASGTAEGDVARLEEMMTDRTRLLAIAHIPTNTGTVFPVQDLGRLTRHRDCLFLLDACQSVGQLPIDVGDIGCDMLTAAGRKFLRGPRGTGFAYVGQKARDRLAPMALDIRSADWIAPRQYRPRDDAARFERWERSVASVLGLGAAARHAMDWGVARIGTRCADLAAIARRGLAGLPGVSVHDTGADLSGIVSFSVEGTEAEQIVAAAGQAGFNIGRSRIEDAQYDLGRLSRASVARIGLHYFNTAEDIGAFLSFLSSHIEQRRKT